MKFWMQMGLATLFAFFTFLVLTLKISYPYHRYLAIVICAIGWIPLFFSFRNRPEFIDRFGHATKSLFLASGAYIAVALSLALLTYALVVLLPTEKTILSDMSPEEMAANISQDSGSLLVMKGEIDANISEMESSGLFQDNIQNLSFEQKQEIKQLWQHFLEINFEIDLIRQKYRGFAQIDYLQDPVSHSRAFLLAYAAHTIQYESAFRVSQMVNYHGLISSFLNQKDENLSLSKDSYFQIKERLTSPKEILRLNAGRAYLTLTKKHLSDQGGLLEIVSGNLRNIEANLLKFPRLFVSNPFEFLEKQSLSLWLPVQKKIALRLSYIRASNREYFIKPEKIQEKRPIFEPGDILLERRGWHATNIGIPGFWTHAALYTGSLSEMDDYFSEITLENGKLPSQYIQEKFPSVFQEFQEKDGEGFERSVIESKRPGVVLESLEFTANADSFAVLRVKTSKEEKFKALMNAFLYFGKPYDYNFDFLSDDALVCSELVYKAYQENPDIHFSPGLVSGRMMMPPNDFAKKFDEELLKKSEKLELILFFDGNEKKGNATEKGADVFRETWKRPKWYIVNDYL